MSKISLALCGYPHCSELNMFRCKCQVTANVRTSVQVTEQHYVKCLRSNDEK